MSSFPSRESHEDDAVGRRIGQDSAKVVRRYRLRNENGNEDDKTVRISLHDKLTRFVQNDLRRNTCYTIIARAALGKKTMKSILIFGPVR